LPVPGIIIGKDAKSLVVPRLVKILRLPKVLGIPEYNKVAIPGAAARCRVAIFSPAGVVK